MATNFRTVRVRPTLLIVADAVVRPSADADVAAPLVANDVFDMFWAMIDALSEQIAPAVVAALPGELTIVPVAFDSLLIANGEPLSTFVSFELDAASRAEGSYDATGGEWPVDSFRSLQNDERRQAMLRGWLGGLLRESGWKGYEDAVASLTPRLVSRAS